MLKIIKPLVGIVAISMYTPFAVASQQWDFVLISLGIREEACERFLTLKKKNDFEAMRDHELKLIMYNRILAHPIFSNTRTFIENKEDFKHFEKNIFPAGNLYQLAPTDINAALFNFFCTNRKPKTKEILASNLQALITTIQEKCNDLRAVERDIKKQLSQIKSPTPTKKPSAPKTEPLWEGKIKPRENLPKTLFRNISAEERLVAFADIINFANAILSDLKNLQEKIKLNEIVLKLTVTESEDLTSSTIIHEDESQGTGLIEVHEDTSQKPKED